MLEVESPRPRSTRDRPAKSPLSEGVILDTAMRILREEGLDAVTMRRLATEARPTSVMPTRSRRVPGLAAPWGR